MDRKRVENRLINWSWEFGFILPDGSFPQAGLFDQLVATPQRVHLWDIILKKLESKEKVQKIRKQILVNKLKSDWKMESESSKINVYNAGIEQKLELWKKKEILEKKIKEKRREIDDLHADIYKRAQLIQNEVCKMAEIEKEQSVLKEKVMISKIMLEKHKENLNNYKIQVAKIKLFGIFNSSEEAIFEKDLVDKLQNIQDLVNENLNNKSFELENEETIEACINELIKNKNTEMKIWDLLLERKMENLNKYSAFEECKTEELSLTSNGKFLEWIKSFEEQMMLDIAENSLQAVLNRTCEKAANLKLKEVLSKIEKLMFNKTLFETSKKELSYLQPDVTGDSFTGRNEKMNKLTKALSFYGLKKRCEFLKHEVQKLAEENQKNEHWINEEEKFEKKNNLILKKLKSLKEEVEEVLSMQKESEESILKKFAEFDMIRSEINNSFKEKKIFELMSNLTKEIREGMSTVIELIDELFLDGFRKIQISPGKDVFEFESLQHCLDNYGGELREFFSKTLISPYDKPESIIAELEDRKSFILYVNEVLSKEGCFEEKQINICNDNIPRTDYLELEKNYKEVMLILSKILGQKDGLTTLNDFIKKVLKSWLEQPYKLMIPDGITINSMTLRQYEKHHFGNNEFQYCSDSNKSFAVK